MKKYLYFAVFSSGLTTLAIELTASRLLGSVFGTSNLVWASIIGLILIYLTVGYFVGGWWADKSPHTKTMYSILAWGAFTSGLVPLISRPVLRIAADAFDQLAVGVLFGSFTSVLILFCVPVTLLGTISPFAIRIAIEDSRDAGKVSGRIYAISTMGSFLGTFLPGLLLIPLIGTTYTFLVFSTFLLIVALIGLGSSIGWRKVVVWLWMPVVLILLTFFLAKGSLKKTTGQIFETESAYNYIQVLERDGYHLLRLNEGQGVHSMWHPTEIEFSGPWKQFLAAPFFNKGKDRNTNFPVQVKSMAIVGLAAGTTARQATAVFGEIEIDGYEIDPTVIQVGQEYFDMNLPNLNAIAQDGRWGLQHSQRQYSIVAVDAYRPPYIPWHMTTREFFKIVHDRLLDEGVMAVNVGRAPNDRRLVNGLASTIKTVFPSVYIMDIPFTFNSIIYATVQTTKISNLYENLLTMYAQDDVHPLLIKAVENIVAFQQPLPATDQVYTDDLTPVEWITNNMVLKYVLFSDMEEIQ